VHVVEGYRSVPVRLANGHRSERTAISACRPNPICAA
jgi:hypothetical protein